MMYILAQGQSDQFKQNVWDNFRREITEITSQGKDVELYIKERKKGLTGQQRAYAHKLLSIMADETGNALEDLKVRLKWKLGLIEKFWVEGNEVVSVRSTESLKRGEYSTFIEAIREWMEGAGIKVPEPSVYGFDISFKG